MTFRNVGTALRSYTAAQLDSLVAKFGPGGTEYADAIKPGTLVWDTTNSVVKVYNGTSFATIAFD